jgi:hypothetical protein
VRLSSICGSKNRYLRLGLLMLGWLLLLEIILRLPPVHSRVERYAHQPIWYSDMVPQRIELVTKHPNADIWFIGSSVVYRGINPDTIDLLINQETGGNHQSLNTGLFAMVYTNYLEEYLTNLYLPIVQPQQPKVIVLGVFPLIFAYTQKIGMADYDYTRDTSGTLGNRISWWLYQHVAIYQLIHTFRYLVTETPAETVESTDRGYGALHGVVQNGEVIEADSTGNDRLEISLGQVQHLNDTLKQRGIRLLVVNFPVYQSVVEQYPGGEANFYDYVNRLSQFAASESIPFLDLQRSLMDANHHQMPIAYFQDYYHLNDDGAKAVDPIVAHFVASNLEVAAK